MLSLRPSTLRDAELLLAWYNDPDTRQHSRNANELSLEEHVAWLAKSLAMPTRKIYIAEHEGTPVGTVRSDRGEDGAVELSWTIAPSMRGRGFGKDMVTQFAAEVHPLGKLIAIVRSGNVASEKIAQALGLRNAGPESPNDAMEEHPLMLWR